MQYSMQVKIHATHSKEGNSHNPQLLVNKTYFIHVLLCLVLTHKPAISSIKIIYSTLIEHFIRYLLDLLCCCSRDALLHTTVVMHGCLRYCPLPVSLRALLLWPLSVTTRFCPHNCCSCFLFFAPFSANHSRARVGLISGPGVPCFRPAHFSSQPIILK